MVSVIVIGVLIILVFLFFKAKSFQHRIYTILIVAFILFFYVSGSRVIAENNVDVTSFNGMVTAGKLYVGWLGNIFENTKDIVGNAIKMDWKGDS